MATLPETSNVPWKPEAFLQALQNVRGADAEILLVYMKLLIEWLDRTYADIADTVNQINADLVALKARYDAHTTHPPPA